ncbi:tyrosine-type recombinase/integrase [Pseudomonas viridiflava]|uniref:tyrosine-type recombinase/integrase n=1 Tax=Pseudomonas viridiflava TaxID=33069 RepID=UPI000F063E27|nr:site-specific integrase [Pseudomonas viridiflava]
MVDLCVRSFVMQSGERYCLIMDRQSGVPVYAPNLFLTTQVRNASRAYATLMAQAGHLLVLYRFLQYYQIDLPSRIHRQHFFNDAEMDALRDFCACRYDANVDVDRALSSGGSVTNSTQYVRLTAAADYLKWVSRQYLDHLQAEPAGLVMMVKGIRHRRPKAKGRNSGLIDRSVDDAVLQQLFGLLEVGSPQNPFCETVQARNRLIVLVTYGVGIRRGELLNIRLEDIDFASNKLRIVRRADQPDDPRPRQPLVKTRDREYALQDWLAAEIHRYVMGDRRQVSNARRCPYLFITHKQGLTVGKPLSVAGYNKLWAVIQQSMASLEDITGHRLRHTWNKDYSVFMDAMKPAVSEARQEAMRSQLQGWKPGSGTAARYNRRFTVEKANEVGLRLQSILQTKGS